MVLGFSCFACEREEAIPATTSASLTQSGGDDPEALALGALAVTVLPDDDTAKPSAEQPDALGRHAATRDGTQLLLPTARELAKRELLENEVGELESLSISDLEQLRLHWYGKGAGIVFQNTTDFTMRLSVRFEASTDPECGETMVRGPIDGKTSVAPMPSNRDCDYDSARVTLYDPSNFTVATAIVKP